MIPLLRLKDRIVQFVGKYEIYVMAAFRFAVGYIAFHMIVTNLDYMDFLTEYPIAILLALLCCFLPSGVMVFCAAVLILLELYSLSMILCLIIALIFLIMFCAYMRFTSRKGMYVMLTPIMSMLGISYTMPVASGLLGEPYAVISVICGDATYFILQHVTANYTLFLGEDDISTSNVISFAVSQLLLDREMYLYLIGFAAAAVVTFCIRKLPVRQSHLIAAAIGIVTQIAIIGGGEVMMGNQAALLPILIGCVVSFLILMIVSFFMHNLDYRRVENVQFEDDDYYYYVRAIPKSFASRRKKKTQKPRPDYPREDDEKADTRQLEEPSDDLEMISAREVRTSAQRGRTSGAAARTESTAGSRSSGTGTSAPQLAAEAQEQAAAAAAAERAAAAAVAERAAAAAQAISEAAGLDNIPDETTPDTNKNKK